MNIAEVERRTGLTRANIRFYEKEGLIAPARSANGYRDYTEADVETLRKVRLLRQLRLSVADIRAVQAGERPLPEAAAKQLDVLEQDIREGQQAYAACRAICDDRAEWDGLDVDKYLPISVLPSYAVAAPGEQDRIPPAGCPWRRYFARSLDLSLYGLIWSMIALWGFRANPAGQIPLPWAMLCNYAAWALVFVFEPLLLHFWGTTVGKWGSACPCATRTETSCLSAPLFTAHGACLFTVWAAVSRFMICTAIYNAGGTVRWRSCRGIWITAAR